MAGQRENDLYQKWRETEPADRREIEAKLYSEVKKHVRAVLWKHLEEETPDLVDETCIAVMLQLGKFRRESKFTTWVQKIARLKAKQYIRGEVASRKVFDKSVAVVEAIVDEDYGKPYLGEVVPTVSPQVDSEISAQEFRESLQEDDAALLRYKEAGFKSKQIADQTGATVDAIDSRWARLKPKAKEFRSQRRK